MSLYDELRRKHGSFIYHSYEFTEQDGSTLLRFHFSIDEYHFYPGWTFPEEFSGLTFDRELADRVAFSLGMAELVSYWKSASGGSCSILPITWVFPIRTRWWTGSCSRPTDLWPAW